MVRDQFIYKPMEEKVKKEILSFADGLIQPEISNYVF